MLQAEDEDFGGEEAVNGFEGQFDAGEEQKEREECPVPAALARRMFPHQKEGEVAGNRVSRLWIFVCD